MSMDGAAYARLLGSVTALRIVLTEVANTLPDEAREQVAAKLRAVLHECKTGSGDFSAGLEQTALNIAQDLD